MWIKLRKPDYVEKVVDFSKRPSGTVLGPESYPQAVPGFQQDDSHALEKALLRWEASCRPRTEKEQKAFEIAAESKKSLDFPT